LLKSIALFSFMRFYLRILADLNEIIRLWKRKVILTITIIVARHYFNINKQKKGTPDNGSAPLNKMNSASLFWGSRYHKINI